ncbi:MAG: Sulfite reductase, dissimilatory-type subunit alpha [Methanoregula sp. PtaU1.Bin051]|nr:MAG: Sulfite reductase, dissimilatory-type subunit alpha [Methanoregula sp. PtaU1.Bin051]
MKIDTGIHMKGGVITERDTDLCTIRIRLPAGQATIDQLRGIAAIVKRYGAGTVHCTTRQTIEIPHVPATKLKKIERALIKNGTPIGSEKDEIVNIIACPGTDRCKFANINTIDLAQRIDAKLFGKEMPVKMRIAISGCPNACTSPMLNEIGIIGRVLPVRKEGMCTGCGTCTNYCKESAIRVKRGVCVLDPEKCVQCGVCIRSCPYGIIQAEHRHYLVTVGGRRGRHPRIGRELVEIEDANDVITVVDRIVNWVYRRAWSGRLLSDQMDEIRFEAFRKEISETVLRK